MLREHRAIFMRSAGEFHSPMRRRLSAGIRSVIHQYASAFFIFPTLCVCCATELFPFYRLDLFLNEFSEFESD